MRGKLMRLFQIISLAAAFMASGVYGDTHDQPDINDAPTDGGISIGSSGRPLIPHTYMVQVDNSVGNVKAYLNDKFRALNVDVDKIAYRVDVDSDLFKGASFTLPPSEANDQIVQSIGAIKSFRVGTVARPAVEETSVTKSFNISDYSDEKLHSLTGVNEARKALNLSGKGIKVAIIDTGVDYMHPALGGGFGPGFKVAYGYDFVGHGFEDSHPMPMEDSDPMEECVASSHGTHVAGIVGAFAYNMPAAFEPPVEFSGVAPNVTLGAYRVFTCKGASSEDVIVKAIFKAHADGSHIINMSLGVGAVYNDDAAAYAVELVSKSGTIVVSAIGNAQQRGLMLASSPGISAGGFGVASFDNPIFLKPTLYANDVPFIYVLGFRNIAINFDSPYDLIANDINAIDHGEQNDGLSTPNPLVNATGKALLIRYTNGRKSAERCDYAASVGAVACILYSDEPTIANYVFGSKLIPSLVTTKEAGAAIVAQLKAGKKVSLVITRKETVVGLPYEGNISDFSSMGLDLDLFIKPDFGAIGRVLSTISQSSTIDTGRKPYNVLSGTSMSSPYAAGMIALLLEAKGVGKIDFKSAQTLLMNTAEPRKIFNSSVVDSVTRQGAGLANIFKAITAKTLVEPPALHLNDTKNTQQHYTITIKNQNSVPITYTVESLGAAMVTGFIPGDDFPQFIDKTSFTPDHATVKFARNNDRVDSLTISIPAGESKQVNVHFTPPAKAVAGLFPIFSGYIQLSTIEGASKKVVASVPYAGMVGSWKDAQVWSRNSPFFTELFLKNYFPTAGSNNTASTGFYADLTFDPLKISEPFSVVNATQGGMVLPVASTSSRYAKVELIFAGDAAQKAKLPPSIRHKSPLGFLSGRQFDWFFTDFVTNPAPIIFREVVRNSPIPYATGVVPSHWLWNGKVTSNTSSSDGAVAVPEGLYRVKISGLRHFGRVGASGDSDYDVVTSPVFKLVY
ncbi:hypothetical protein HDU97_004429 [Phlyctochytrium planicorne]|nr:hypothetical protein HDU97_004429 [Phlyctochytrium planicorne]